MTVGYKKLDRKVYTATVAINTSVDVTGGALSCPNNSTMLVSATCLFSHFAGTQNAGGTIFASFACEGTNGSYSAIPVMTGGAGPLGANPENGYATIPPTSEAGANGLANISGTAGLIPPTAVWAISAGGVVTLTVTNAVGSTAGFDVAAWVDIYTMSSS